MSASVFKPIRPLSLEMPRLRVVSRGVQRVRRVLFEPVDHVETEKFLEREMAKQRLNECNKWEFDFHAGKPYVLGDGDGRTTTSSNNNNNNNGENEEHRRKTRFVWTALTPTQITRAPKKLNAAGALAAEVDCDNAHLYPSLPDKAAASITTTTNNTITTHPATMVVNDAAKRQSKITDFMQSRKRGADLAFGSSNSNKKPQQQHQKLSLQTGVKRIS